MREIDVETWKRREHYAFYRRVDFPQYNVCFNLDISGFLERVQKENLPFYHTMMYFSVLCANQFPEFKQRVQNDRVLEHDIIHPGFTDIRPGDDLFRIVTVEMQDSLPAFLEAVRIKIEEQKGYFSPDSLSARDDMVYITSLPWTTFTSVSHPGTLTKDDSVPRLAWGKFYEDRGKTLMPYSVQVSHVFVDGIHVSRFQEALQTMLNAGF